MAFKIKSSGSYYATFDDKALTANRIYTLPDASGSLLTSNITQNITVSSSISITGSMNITGSLTVDSPSPITLQSSNLVIGTSSGDEGGEILLVKPQTNTALTGSGVTIDVYQNKIRFFEQGGNARGGYFDLTALGASASTNLLSGASVTNTGDNRVITSDGTTAGLVAESNMSFDGSTLRVTGSINMGTGSVVNPLLTGYYETMVSKSVANDFGGGIVNIDLRAGNVHKIKLDAAIMDFNIQNNPTSLQASTFTLILEGDGTARAVSWGGEVTWPNGAPAIVSGSGYIDVYSFVSFNSGTEYLGLVITQNQIGLA
jgi:hypothetical protein